MVTRSREQRLQLCGRETFSPAVRCQARRLNRRVCLLEERGANGTAALADGREAHLSRDDDEIIMPRSLEHLAPVRIGFGLNAAAVMAG